MLSKRLVLISYGYCFQKDVPKETYISSIRDSWVGNCLFLLLRGWEIDHQETNKLQIPGDTSAGGGHGYRTN